MEAGLGQIADGPPPLVPQLNSVPEAGFCETALQLDFDDEVAFRAVRHLHDLAGSQSLDPIGFVVSFTHPHDSGEVRRRHRGPYDPQRINLPEVGLMPWEAADPDSQRIHQLCGVDDADLTRTPRNW